MDEDQQGQVDENQGTSDDRSSDDRSVPAESTERTTDAGAAGESPRQERGDSAASEDPTPAPTESDVREVLRNVIDPEIRLDVVTLGLIRGVVFHEDETEVQMILTTPFCPYGGMLVQQVKDMTRSIVAQDVRVTMLDEPWSPDMIEGADLAEWGLL